MADIGVRRGGRFRTPVENLEMAERMTLLREFAVQWGDRILGAHGFITEHNGELWVWTHSYSPSGREFFPIAADWDEVEAMIRMIGPESEW